GMEPPGGDRTLSVAALRAPRGTGHGGPFPGAGGEEAQEGDAQGQAEGKAQGARGAGQEQGASPGKEERGQAPPARGCASRGGRRTDALAPQAGQGRLSRDSGIAVTAGVVQRAELPAASGHQREKGR